jgi:hypothetical protein
MRIRRLRGRRLLPQRLRRPLRSVQSARQPRHLHAGHGGRREPERSSHLCHRPAQAVRSRRRLRRQPRLPAQGRRHVVRELELQPGDGDAGADLQRPRPMCAGARAAVRALRLQRQRRLLRFLHHQRPMPGAQQLCRRLLRTQRQRVGLRAGLRMRVATLCRRRVLQRSLHRDMQGLRRRHTRDLHPGPLGSAARHAGILRGKRDVRRPVLVGVSHRLYLSRRRDDLPIGQLFGDDRHRACGLQRRGKLPRPGDDIVPRLRLRHRRRCLPVGVSVGQPLRHRGPTLLRRRRVCQRTIERRALPDRPGMREPAVRRRRLLQRRLPAALSGLRRRRPRRSLLADPGRYAVRRPGRLRRNRHLRRVLQRPPIRSMFLSGVDHRLRLPERAHQRHLQRDGRVSNVTGPLPVTRSSRTPGHRRAGSGAWGAASWRG